jgi:peptidoglycan hydrolase CwlO-like protein
MEIEDKKDKEIKELKEKIKILEEEIKSLKNIKPNVDVEKPTTTRAIRG